MYRIQHDIETDEVRSLKQRLAEKVAQLEAMEFQIQQKEQEVDKIADIQKSLLPDQSPTIAGIRIAVSHVSPEKAGGDYFDFVPLQRTADGEDAPDGSWLVIIADATGHGPASAVIMTMMHSILHAYPGPHDDPATILRFINREMCDKHLESFFATCVLAILDPQERTFHYACAGHYAPLVKEPHDGIVMECPSSGGLPLGIDPDVTFYSHVHHFRPGQTLLLYTDGAIEEVDNDDEPFGVDALKATFANARGEPADQLKRINLAIANHRAGGAQTDDKTLVAIRAL